MKILSITITILLFIGQQAYSADQQATESSNNTIVEPAAGIKDSVLGELEQGRWELVMFWATYCPVCKRDFEKLAKFIDENPEIPFSVIGVVVDGIDEREKAINQINNRHLDYTHVMTDFDRSNKLYQEVTNTALIGVPSQLLYDKENKLAGFSRNALDIEALELAIYE